MKNHLPYFRWFVADAEMDDLYSGMTDAELGFYHRCLNRSWVNGGLPADPDERARVMQKTKRYADRMWKRVGKAFVKVDDRVVNPRQEEERKHAISKSEAAAASVRCRRDRMYERRSNDPLRASDADAVSDSSGKTSETGKSPPRNSEWPLTLAAVQRCCPETDELFVLRIVEAAMQAWVSLDIETKAIECTDYTISEAVERCYKSSQQGAGLFLRTVPNCIATWAKNGQQTPPKRESEREKRMRNI